MEHVKLPLVDKEFLMKNVNSESLMTEDVGCIKLLLEATTLHAGMRSESSSRTTPRKHFREVSSYIFATGGVVDYGDYAFFQIYNF